MLRLKPAVADYENVKSKSECLPGTQAKIQESILGHIMQGKSRFCWLRGSPGTGKTAISMSVASTLDKQHKLAASFFWDKNQRGTGLDSIDKFPSTIAHQLSVFSENFKMSLIRHLRKPGLGLVQGFLPNKQMEALVIEPMCDLWEIFSSSEDRYVIVLDGLDECERALPDLMKLVSKLHELPPCFAVVVSCRPEPVVKDWAKAQGSSMAWEDVDQVDGDDRFQTVRRIIEKKLENCI